MKNVILSICIIAMIVFIWIWHHQIQFNDKSRNALFHLRNGEFDDAIEAYTKAIRHKKYTLFFTREPSAYNNLGQAFLRKAKYDQAIAAFQKALEIQPNAVEAYINLATVYLKQNLPDPAIQSCEKAIQIFPNAALAHYNLACAYALKDESEKAIDALKRAIDLDKKVKAFATEERAFDGIRSHPIFSSE
ncbi:MAG: tetratricopeptide repeat protein [Candidatus Poribacteria bacterium]|nr:tetratricopeptide repeat protein [Candidatus Poribacteria bacterium]